MEGDKKKMRGFFGEGEGGASRRELSQIISDEKGPRDSIIRNQDNLQKAKMKLYADKKAGARPHALIPGDSVLVRQQKTGKLSTPYNPKPYVVEQTKGSMITARRGPHTITRNASHFKSIRIPARDKERILLEQEPQTDDVPLSTDITHTDNTCEPPSPEEPPSDAQTLENSPPGTPMKPPGGVRRSQRSRRAPSRFDDYV